MKTESNIIPQQIEIHELQNGEAEVLLTENVVEKQINEGLIYEYNLYIIKIQNREGLKEQIKNNFNIWLQFAKDKEKPIITEPTEKERLKAVEDAILFITLM
jgi:hypothetical protein